MSYMRKIQEIRRSGAAGLHKDKRTRRRRSRGQAKRFAIREQTA